MPAEILVVKALEALEDHDRVVVDARGEIARADAALPGVVPKNIDRRACAKQVGQKQGRSRFFVEPMVDIGYAGACGVHVRAEVRKVWRRQNVKVAMADGPQWKYIW